MLKKVWNLFTSVRLTIVLLILLSALSVAGTVVPQNGQEHEYLRLYKQSTYELLKSIGMTDMYHCWWFMAVLGLFTLNLVACSLNRLPAMRRLLQPMEAAPDTQKLQGMSNFRKLTVKKPGPDTVERLAGALGRFIGSPRITRAGGITSIAAEKGRFSHLGFYLTHAGMITIIVGVLIGTMGYQGHMKINEGETRSTVVLRDSRGQLDLGFALRCDRFEVSYYDEARMPKDYKSWLVVIENGQEVLKKVIEVNDPLVYRGIYFYQSNYGISTSGGGEVLLTIQPVGAAPGQGRQYRVRTGQRFTLEGTKDQAMVETFLPDFAMDEGKYFSRSSDPKNPAARVIIYRGGKELESSWVFMKHPDFHSKPGAAYSLQLTDFYPRYFTGLQVTRDPGVNVVWLGCVLLIAGICMAFFMSHRRVWLVLEEKDGGLRAMIAGSANKNRQAFAADFNNFCERIKNLEKQP